MSKRVERYFCGNRKPHGEAVSKHQLSVTLVDPRVRVQAIWVFVSLCVVI